MGSRHWLSFSVAAFLVLAGGTRAQESAARRTEPAAAASVPITIDSPMPAPAWALAERALLEANADGVKAYAARLLDERGYLPVRPRWGVNDGPDDLMENIRNWPLAHALGGSDAILDAWDKAWEGHLDQFSRAKIPGFEPATDGIYYKEFTTQFDWEHISEGFGPFYFYGART